MESGHNLFFTAEFYPLSNFNAFASEYFPSTPGRQLRGGCGAESSRATETYRLKPGSAERVHGIMTSNRVINLLIRRSEHDDSAQQTGPLMRSIRGTPGVDGKYSRGLG